MTVTQKQNPMLVTCALPYANGALHLGNMVEFIQADIWVRFQKLQKNTCFFISGDDAHGTPIMLNAEKQGITSEQLIQRSFDSHQQDIEDFQIDLDHYYTTHSPENKALSEEIYLKLQEKGDIVKRTISQAFDNEKKLFLPDRYVKGTCPKCAAVDQYGDNCEACGATYSPTELINPKSVISNTPPIQKESEHYFFCLENYEALLKSWTHADHLQPEIRKKLNEWFEAGLQQWDISRDAPYFGFEIPNAPGKYFYVWLDAPIGYISIFKHFCEHNKQVQFEDFWPNTAESKTQLYHFIGKDIVYFHALFWPAILSGSALRTPTAIFVHGFLTINGQKMSKSRGTLIEARTYLNHFPPEYLRYYYACKLTAHVEDLDLNFEDFSARINSDLVGKYINIASRCSKIIENKFEGKLSERLCDPSLFNEFLNAKESIRNHFEQRAFSHAMREIRDLADSANRYLASEAPWQLLKGDAQAQQKAHEICSMGINLFRILSIYLKPVLPKLVEKIEAYLNLPEQFWADLNTPLLDHTLNPFKPFIQRVQTKEIENMIEETKQDKTTCSTPLKETIDIQDFAKLDLRVGQILKAETVEGADKLLKLQITLGDPTPRQIFAGIKTAYSPESLENKLVAVVANLKPRQMRFGLSEGMVIAAGPGGEDLWLLSPDSGAKPGMAIK